MFVIEIAVANWVQFYSSTCWSSNQTRVGNADISTVPHLWTFDSLPVPKWQVPPRRHLPRDGRIVVGIRDNKPVVSRPVPDFYFAVALPHATKYFLVYWNMLHTVDKIETTRFAAKVDCTIASAVVRLRIWGACDRPRIAIRIGIFFDYHRYDNQIISPIVQWTNAVKHWHTVPWPVYWIGQNYRDWCNYSVQWPRNVLPIS